MENTRDGAVRGSFTRYLESALKRNRRDYENKEKKRLMVEEVTEPEQLSAMTEAEPEENPLQAAMEVPWEPETIRAYMSAWVSEDMQWNFAALTDDEIVIVFAKVFCQLMFKEIGDILKQDWRKVASSYSYARKKLKKELRKNEF